MYKETLENVITHFTGERHADEFAGAREDYFHRTGKVFQDEPMYETRVQAFLEWYIFDRDFRDFGVPPVRLHFLLHREGLDAGGAGLLEALQSTAHGLFDVTGRSREALQVKDLFDGKCHEVEVSKHYAGVEKGHILDTRLIPLAEAPVFSDAMWLHPKEVREFILESLHEPRRVGREQFQNRSFDLAWLHLKQDRYRHVSASQIYTWEGFRREAQEG